MNKIITIIRETKTARFLIPAGVILIAFGIVMFIINTRNKDYVKTEATVTQVEVDEEASTDAEGNRTDATYKVNVKYTVDSKEYEAELGGVSKYKEGQKMTIYYNPADPSQITQTKSLVLPLILCAAGIAAVVAGILSAVKALKRYKKMKAQEEEWANG